MKQVHDLLQMHRSRGNHYQLPEYLLSGMPQLIQGSYLNTGRTGIYFKANDEPNFRATEDDIMGWWTCSYTKDSAPIPATDSPQQILTKLVNANLQYNGPWGGVWDISKDKTTTTHALFWSSSVVHGPGLSEIKASVDTGYNSVQPKVFKNYDCQLNHSSPQFSQVLKILSKLDANSTLGQWVFSLPALIYDGVGTPASEYSDLYLEQHLNALTMVQGGWGSTLQKPLPNSDPTYGCIILKTFISPFVILLALFVAAALLGILAWWAYLRVSLGKGGNSLDPFPNNLLTWMLQAARESSFTTSDRGQIPEKESAVSTWVFGADPQDSTFVRVKRRFGAVPLATMDARQQMDSGLEAPQYSPFRDQRFNTAYEGV
jgi:hypothetical protein